SHVSKRRVNSHNDNGREGVEIGMAVYGNKIAKADMT
ncbi:MAG: hypothetical protein JWP99_1566, partial [Devosia sp.]|nr:hypothetical protein [Devosia sp.]